jgi:hypothetical protein
LLRFTPNDIVRAIDGVTAAGLQVYAVEITPTGAIKINTELPPHPYRKKSASRPTTDRTTQHPSKNKLSRSYEFRHSRRLGRLDYRHFDLCHRHGWSLPAVTKVDFGPTSKIHPRRFRLDCS